MKKFSLILALVLASAAPGRGKDVELTAVRTKGEVSMNPLDAAWRSVAGVEVPLMPQSVAPPGGGGAVSSARVKALRTERELFVRLDWPDATDDGYPSKAENFSDAAALQFPALPSEWPSPFMGDRDNPVVIWRWSASAQKDLDGGYQSNAAGRPRVATDFYAYAGDPTFRTGEGAGNILSNRRRLSPVENLAARGFGTLTLQHEQPVAGKGALRKGRRYVVFRRELNGTPAFWDGTSIPFAVAIWDGRARERNGAKSVSVWQTLSLADAAASPQAGAASPRAGAAWPEKDPVARGRRVYRRFGCGTCHGAEAEGGVANPNAQTNPIPALTRVKEGFNQKELLDVVFNGREPARKDPSGPPPPFRMNAWKAVMDESEGEALAAYLFSLMKEEAGSEW